MPWDAATVYDVGDTVLFNGAPWRALAPCCGVKPGHGPTWRNVGGHHRTGEGRGALRGNPHVTEAP